MSITRTQVTSNAELAAWMQENAVPNIFKSVSYDSSSQTITATDDSDNLVLSFETDTFKAYRAENNSIDFSSGGYAIINNGFPAQIIGCDNGFMLIARHGVNGSNRFVALFSKTNNGEPAIIFNRYGSATDNQVFYNGVKHVAFGDSPTMSTTTNFTPESGNQTVITPFITNADVGGKSYTPSAGYMPAHSNYGSGLNKFLLGADMYITNGYWCIKDGGAE